MKSRRDYYSSRKALMLGAFVLYAVAFFLLELCFVVNDGYATIVCILSIFLMFGIICSILAHRNKEYLFCPQCGSKRIVKNTLFGIPAEITCDCPDCGAKIDLDKPVNKD